MAHLICTQHGRRSLVIVKDAETGTLKTLHRADGSQCHPGFVSFNGIRIPAVEFLNGTPRASDKR